MKCGSFVKWEERRKKGKGDTYLKPVEIVTWRQTGDLGPFADRPTSADLLAQGYTMCDGKVTATIAADTEPEWGGVSAALHIGYLCDKCGNTYFPHLPQDGSQLGEFVTVAVAAAEAAPMMAASNERERAEQRRLQGFIDAGKSLARKSLARKK